MCPFFDPWGFCSHYEVFLIPPGTDTKLDKEVAIKLIPVRDGAEILRAEAEMYQALSGGTGIPGVLWFSQEYDYFALVYKLLGPLLEDLFNYCDR